MAVSGDAAASRPCPLCGGWRRSSLYTQRFAVVEESIPLSGYDVVVCDVCGFGFADGIPSQDAFDLYYRQMSKYEYHQRDGAESSFDRQRLARIADLLSPHIPRAASRILDVGCATGRLLANLRAHGFANVTGLDPSPVCALAAGRLYGITVVTMTLEMLASTGRQFDVVLMIGVLEHLRELTATFSQLAAVLPPGGLLYVEVPDATAFADWPNAPYQDFSTEHINFFSAQSLTQLMRRHGFHEVWLERNHRHQSHQTVMSNVSALYRYEPASGQVALVRERETEAGLKRYVADSAEEERRLDKVIDIVVTQDRPLLVWGVGTHTARLMATSRLSQAPIVAFLESNARYHGRTLLGRPIWPPGSLKSRLEPVLISSRVFQKEIADQIRFELECTNELILLYDV